MPIPPPPNAERKFHGTIMDLWQWEQRLFDGTTETFECVTRPDTVSVIPFLDEKTVLLTRQEQPHNPRPFFDVPGGRVDAGETMEAAVRRELHEETGHKANRLIEWHRQELIGIYRYEAGLFLATGLHDGSGPHVDAGEKIELLPTKWDDLVRMCLKRELRQANVMLAVLAMEFDPETTDRLHTWLRGQ